MEDYKIELGIDIRDSDFKTLQTKIKSLEDDKIKIKLDDSTVDAQVANIKQQLESLGKTKGLKLDTATLEKSFGEIASIIKQIKSAIGTLDSKKGMTSILTTINKINKSLTSVSKQFVNLNKSLNVLSGKDLSLNFNLKMGNPNSVKAMTDYGQEVRRNTLPALQEQVAYLKKALGGTQEADKALERYLVKLHQGFGGVSAKKTIENDMINADSLSGQMAAYEKYIGYLKQIASINNVDLSGFNAKFSKTSDELIDDTVKIQSGVKETEEQFEKLKQLFGSGIDVEGLGKVLEPIISDLGEIKETLIGLSKGTSLSGLTESFNNLSEVLKKLIGNFILVKNTLNTDLSGTSSSISNVAQEFKEADIKIDDMKGSVEGLKNALHSLGFNDNSINTITKDLDELGVSVKNVTTRLDKDGDVTLTIKGIDQYERAVTVMKSLGRNGVPINLGTTISQDFRETENAFKRLKTLAKEMGSLDIKIAGLDADKNKNEVAELTSQLDRLKIEYNELYSITSKNLSDNQIDELTQSFQNASDKVNQLNAKLSDTSSAQKLKNEFEELLSVAKQIDNINLQIGKLDADSNSNEVAELTRQLKELEQTYQNLRNKLQGKLSSNQLSSLSESTFKVQDKLKQLDAQVADTKTKLASGIKLNFGKYDTEVKSLESNFGKLSNKTIELSKGIEFVKQALATMKSASTDDELISAAENYKKILKDVENQLKQNQIAEKDAIDASALKQSRDKLSLDMDNWLKDNSAAAKDFGGRIRELQAQINNCDKTTLSRLKAEFTNIKKEAQLAGKTTQTFSDRLKNQFAKYSSYFSIASLFMYAEQGLRDMFEQVKAIDSAMTELKKVTDETDESYNQFLSNAASRSKELGTTIDGLVKSTADFARLGYEFKDAQGLAEVANIYAVVGDEINGVEGATESLISTMAAFKDETSGMSNSDFAMNIIDIFNEIGNNFAISSGGLGEALERSASSLKAANNSIHESAALITAANEVTQDPEKVGNALKTVSMRIRSAKTEMEEAGIETDGMVESTAKLRQEIMALSGVDIMLNENTFKSTYQIMDELSRKWEDLSDISQATIIELMAGKHQGNIFASLMSNFDTARDALETSLNSSGSAMAEHAKWSESLEARLNKLKSTWQSLSQSFLQSNFLKATLDGIIALVNGLDKLIDTFGTLPTLITAFAAFKSFSGKGIFKTIEDEATLSGKRITNIFSQAFSGIKNANFTFETGFEDALNKDVIALQNYIAKLQAGVPAEEAFSQTMKNASVEAQQFAKNMDIATMSASQYETVARQNQVSMMAMDKSFKSTKSLINEYNSGLQNCKLTQTEFIDAIGKSNTNFAKYLSGLNGTKASMGGYITSLIGAKVATFALEAATMLLNATLTMGISIIVSGLISAVTKWINAEEELAEKVDEVTSKFKEQSKELQKLRGDYDTTNESSMITKYDRLSKGVDNLGRNVSLTADEYSEYQSIVNQIADQIPSLVSGYDSQGNALLSCKGNVEELTKAYEDLIKAQNREIFNNVDDIGKDFKNAVNDSNSYNFWNTRLTHDIVKDLDTMLKEGYTEKEIKGYFDNDASGMKWKPIAEALQNAGIDASVWATDSKKAKILAEAMKVKPDVIQNIIDDFEVNLETLTEGMKSIAQATLSDAFDISGSEYYDMSDTMQSVAKNIVNGFDFEFYKQFKDNPLGVETYINDMLDQLNALNEKDGAKIEAAFDLQTQFNGGEISYGEYVNGLENTGKLIDGLGLDEELETQLKLSLGLNEEGIVEGFAKLKNRLSSEEYFDIMPSSYIPFIEGLTNDEISVLWQIIPELEATEYKEDIADIKAALEKEMMLQGLTFDLNLEVETAGLEALNTALSESVSATGLSSESITALKGRYSSLEAQGYDLSSMFEETSTGIRLNRQEFDKLENAYATDKLAEVDGDLIKMKSTYDDLGEAIKNCDDPIRKSELFNERQTLAKRISEAATLAHQYKGLTNAYNDWLSAEEAGQERDMYEKVIEGFENVDDEISRGWVDDGTIKFLELLTGRTDLAGKSGKQLKEIYDGLDDTIKNTGYSIRDFFTVDEDGNSTNTGVYNFLDAIGQLEEEEFGGKDVVKRDKDGNIIGFDFKLAGGDEVIAEALGVSEELVQIMVRAADDAGFVVSMDGTYRQLADLQNEAKAAADYLHEIGKTDFEFDFNTTSVENLKTQLEEAHKILDSKEFWNKDGTFNFNADGATQAMQIVSTLQAKLDNLTAEKYGIGLTVEDEEFEEPLENLQEYGRTVQTLNQLRLNPKVNAEEIDECETKLDELAQEFNELDTEKKIEIGLEIEKGVALTQENLDKLTDDKKIKLGFVDDDGKPLTNVVDVIQNKIESGEVTIPTVLDIQANMDKNIEKLADLAWLNSGFLTEDEEKVIRQKYNIEIEADEVDTTDVENKIDSSFIRENKDKSKTRKTNIQVIANTFGIEDIDDLTLKLKGLDDKTIEAVAEVVGRTDVDSLKQTIAKLEPKKVEAIVEAIGKGDVDGLKTAINQLKPRQVKAIATALGYKDVDELNTAIDNLDPKTVEAVANALGITDVENLKGAIDNVQGKDVEVKATTSGESKLSGLKGLIDSIKSKTVTITSWFKKITSGGSTRNDSNGFSDVNGTANVNGTTGRAFKQGSWGTKNSGTALVGELGAETLVRDGRYYTIGDNGAEFIKYRKGDIIFNHVQSEELFKNGKVTSGGGRGKAIANGTAFAQGTAFSSGTGGFGKVIGDAVKSAIEKATKDTSKSVKETVKETVKKDVKSNSSNNSLKNKTKNTNNNGSNSTTGGIDKVDGTTVGNTDKFEETIDFVEIAISRIEQAIDNLDRKANNVYKSWSERNSALSQEIGKVGEEINIQSDAYDEYIQEANNVGLSESWAEKVRIGTIDIYDESDFSEETAKKIQEYREWYEKALACKDAVEELKQKEAELYKQRFDNVSAQYDGILNVIEHEKNMLDEYIAQSEAQGHLISAKYYNALISNEKNNITKLQSQKNAMLAELQTAMQSGTITKGSEAWYDMVSAVDEVTLAIEQSNTAILEYQQTIQQLRWESFDILQERISAVTEEADFLIELMSNDKLHDDNGRLTNEGSSTMGLHGQNYNTYMYQADKYAKEAERLKKELAKDPYDTELESRYREMISLQQEHILAAENEKEAIRDLVEEGINLELDALDDRIQKYEEALNSQKDLYDYQKRVEEQTKNIASLQKQMAAYQGDDSEEAKAKIQELKVSLDEAKDDLAETEYEKLINDTESILDDLYLEYENILNTRLDNIDALVSDVISQINADASMISTTLSEKVDSVGYTLSESMQTVWDTNSTKINNVITTYGEKFSTAQTTTNNALNTINTNLQSMITQLNSIANTNVTSAKTSSSANSEQANAAKAPVKTPVSVSNKNDNKKTPTATDLMGIAAAIWVLGGKNSGWGNDPFREGKLTEKLGGKASQVQYLVNKFGANGELYRFYIQNGKNLDKYKYNAFATGKQDILNDQYAWTQENGQELIVRPSDGAILTPLAKGDSVLNASASGNIWNMANNPAEFIKDNLKLDTSNIPNTSSVNNTYTQNFENVTFSMPNVHGYNELLTEMQKDPKFEKLILSMTIDRIAGKSGLAKGKSIR